jgi:hypothetical protein
MKRLLGRRLALVVTLGVSLLAAGGIAWAAIPDSSGAINACYANSNGKLRAVDAPADCSGGETAIALGGPTIGYATSRPDFIAIGTTPTVVASLKLPAGKYLVHAKLDLLDTTFTGGVFVACNLVVGGTGGFSDASWNTLGPVVTSAPSESMALQTPLVLPAEGGIALTCVSPDAKEPPTARYRQLDAIKLDGLVIQ